MALRVAIFPWGDVIETFLEPLGLGIAEFAAEMSGGWLFGYVAALASAGAEAVVICPSDRVRDDTELTHRATGAPMCFVPKRRRAPIPDDDAPLRRWLDEPARRYRRALARFGCSRILCQEYDYPRFDRLVALGRRIGMPVFATFQGGDRDPAGVEGWMRRRSLAAAAGLIVASGAERERLARAYPGLATPIASIPNPLEIGRWQAQDRAAARAGLGLAVERFVVVCHGRIDIWRKGLDMLLEAWRRELAARADAELVLIGSGQDHDAFAAMLSAPDLPNVRWLSRYTLDRDEIRAWLSAADAYVSASRVEGMPVAPLEAMACGLPVVATEAQGVRDIFPDGERSGALVVPRESPAALAAALGRLADDAALRARLGEAGRRRVEDGFAVAPVGRALVEFLGRSFPFPLAREG